MICENPLNFENNIQSKRHFCGANYYVQWAQKINCHVCFSNIITETKKIILFFSFPLLHKQVLPLEQPLLQALEAHWLKTTQEKEQKQHE